MQNRKVILYIATSLDGYIAKPGDDLSFLSIVEQPGEDYGYNSFIRDVDTVILGRKTYDWVMKQVPEFPHADKEVYIITRQARPAAGSVNFYTEDLDDLISSLRQKKGKNIFIDGGAELVHALMKNNLIDEFIISIIPIFLGDGIALFKPGYQEQKLKLVNSTSFASGLVQLHYRKAD
jgi:dihydrofolate reductase